MTTTGTFYLDALLAPDWARWNFNAPGTSLTVTYGFMTTMPAYVYSPPQFEFDPFQPLTAAQRDGVNRAVALFESVANVDFVFRSDGDNAQIRLGSAVLDAGEAAHTYYPSPSADWAGDVWFNSQDPDVGNQSAGTYGFMATLHEMGHALGLKHSFDDGSGDGPGLPSDKDNRQYTVMSYNAPPAMSGVEPSSLMLYDIAALQYLYGANTSYQAGNTNWRWNANETFRFCIWDGGGNDTLDASNQTRRVIINLNPGTFSSFGAYQGGDAVNNLSIAYNCWIENANGGSGDDTITGNQFSNRLDGGAGNDTVVYSGNRADYVITRGDGQWTVSDQRATSVSDGTDTLFGIEFLQFTDGTITITNHAPVVAINGGSLNPARGTATIAASSFFSVTDADNDTITQYKFFDGTAGNGRFELNGAPQVELTNITINAGDLANFRYRTSTTGAGDTLWVQAFDGTAWSAWKSFNVAAPANVAPIASVQNLAPAKGTAFIAGASLFTVTDPDDANMAKYRFFDGTAGNGRFQLNGLDQVELTNIEIDASDLANFRFRTSTSGSDVLWVQAFDGTAWSTWKSFTVAPPANIAPVVTVQNLTPAHTDAFIAGANLFTVSDPDDASVAKYRFFDGTSGNGRFQLNGINQVELTNIEIDAANLANFRYATSTTGAGDVLWVQAFDGFDWGTWKSFTVAAPPNALPVITVNTANLNPPHGTATVAASSFFGVSDADSDTITQYRFFDGNAGNGRFELNGAPQVELTNITINAGDLANFRYRTSATGTGDTLWVQAFDGIGWSAWKSFNVAAPPNAAPVVTVNQASLSPAHGTATIAASSFFSTADADNDTITKFRFFDGNAGNGRFELNGAPQVELTNITIDASDLASFTYRTSTTGTGDTLWVQAFDGTAWSAWKSFNVAAPANVAPTVFVEDWVYPDSPSMIGAGALFVVNDPDDANMVRYRFFDSEIGSGAFMLNGLAQQEQRNIEINAADLPNLIYLKSPGTKETLWVQAFDGTAWSQWAHFDATSMTFGLTFWTGGGGNISFLIDPNTPPVVTASNTSAQAGTSVAISPLVSATDADGDAITTWRFRDTTAGRGVFRVDGVVQADDSWHWVDVAANQLGTVDFLAGNTPGFNRLEVMAFDGTEWSEWKPFVINTLAPT